MFSNLGDKFVAADPWIALAPSLVAFYACLRRYRRAHRATDHFWIELTLGSYLAVQSFFGFVPTTPKWIQLSVHVIIVLCFIRLLWIHEDHAKHGAPG